MGSMVLRSGFAALAMLLGALIDPMGRILTKKGVQVTRFRRTHGREMNVK